MLANLLTNLARKPIIYSMTGTGGNDATLDGLADEGHIADDVEQLVAGALILPLQGLVLDISQVGSIAMLHMQHIGQRVKALLSGLALINNDSVVQIATLNQVGLKQGLNIAHEDKGACWSNLGSIFCYVIYGGKLAVDELRLERAHCGERHLIVGQNGDARTGFFVLDLNLLANDIPVFGGILLLNAYLLNLLHILDGRAVEDGELRTVDLNETVVDSQCIEGRKTVLNG